MLICAGVHFEGSTVVAMKVCKNGFISLWDDDLDNQFLGMHSTDYSMW